MDKGELYKDKPTKLILINNFKNKQIHSLKTANYDFKEVNTKIRIEDIESYGIYLTNYKKYDTKDNIKNNGYFINI